MRWSAWSVLRRMVVRRRRALATSYALHAVWAVSEALVPVVIGAVIDNGIVSGDGGAFASWLGVLAGLMIVLSYGYRFGARIGARAAELEAHELRVEIAAHALHPRGVRSSDLPGETLSLATTDADQVGLLLRLIAFASAALTGIVVTAGYLLAIDARLGLLVLLGVPIVLGLVQLASPLVSRRTDRQQDAIAGATGVATDLLTGLRPLKGIGGQPVGLARYRRASRRARDAGISTASAHGYLFGASTALSGVFLAVVALVAGRLALDGDITLGELIAVVGLTQFLAEPVAALGEISAFGASAHASAGRIARYLATDRLIAGGNARPADPHLVLRAVSAGPLHELTIPTRPGQLTAVAFDDPAAADALIEVLTGERTVASGAIELGGIDLSDLDVHARRQVMIISPHDAHLFEGSVRDNVDPSARLSDDEFAEALAAVAADEIVAGLPDGPEAAVTAAGRTLSGGQRQRLALARALAAARPVLVLHDPTSAVDAVTERIIAEGVRHYRDGLTTLVITGSPAFLDVADEVVVVREGRVETVGRHRDLLRTDTAYAAAVLR